ncbi:MAG: TonB-dependent receptor [Bacteroidota bacterium]
MRQVLCICFVLGVYTTGIAQISDSCNYALKGVFLDIETREPIPYVYVQVERSNKFAVAKEDGSFVIEGLCSAANSLKVSCAGYCDTTCVHHQGPQIFLKKKERSLETVTIEADRNRKEGIVTVSQQTLSKDVLATDLTQTLATALSEVEGVTVASIGNNVQLPVIHGLYGNRVLILNNGLKHGFQNWGTDHGPEIDVASADRVTIVKGAAGVRYGPEALGGAIIVEADPLRLNKSFHANVGSGYQTNGRGYSFNAKIGQGLEKWSYHVGANYVRIGDRHTPDYSLTNTGKIETSFNAGVRYHLDHWDFKAYYSLVDQNLGLLRSSVAHSGTAIIKAINSDEPIIINPFSYDINEPNQLAQHHLGKIEASWWYADDAKLSIRFGSQLNKREEYDVRRNAENPIIDLDLITNDLQLEWKHPKWSSLDGMIGLQAFTQNNDNNPGTFTTPFIPNYNTFRISGFIVENLKKDRNTFEIGARIDYESNNVRGREANQNVFRDQYDFANLTASFGFIRQISDNTVFRTNLGTAWRTPNMAELFSFGQHGFRISYGLLRYYTNENGELRTNRVTPMRESTLSPEKGYKWISEWRTQKNSDTYTLTFYTHYIENFIFNRPLAVIGTIRGPMPVFIYDQADALFVGTDFSWQKRWSSSLNGTFGVSYLWSENLKKNETLINQPPITASYKLVWEAKKPWIFTSSEFSIKPSYTFRQFQAPRTIPPEDLIEGLAVITLESEIFDFKDAPEGFFLLDASWRFKLGKFDASLSVQNTSSH